MLDRGFEVAKLPLGLPGRGLDEVVVIQQLRRDVAPRGLLVVELLQQSLAVCCERAMERRDRREKPLLEICEQKARPRPAGRRSSVVVEHRGEPQLGRARRQSGDADRFDDALGKGLPEAAQIFFEPADHHRLKLLRIDVEAAGETLRVEDFEQGGEGVGMAVVRRRGQEQPMLE